MSGTQLRKKPGFVETGGRPPSAKTFWTCVGTNDEQEVQVLALNGTPNIVTTIYGTLFRQDLQLRQTADRHFDITVPYGTRQNATGAWTWDFDTTGGTVHVTTAREEVNRYPVETAPNQRGVINVDRDTVVGTDIVIPAMRINVQFRHPQGQITLARTKAISNITGTINSTPFLTFAPGEVLFLGGRGSDGSSQEASVGYQFAMSSNATNLSIGDIAGIVKAGHDVIWVKYEDKVENAGGVSNPIRIPQHVYVDRVYETIDMATALGFGGE